ncbi:ubiquinol-cytochrome C chaperone family protein [Brevundimonas sp. SORGH_AS_0993]|uniref:ubiquinol-cytochrome C chaperone family protein n=1 Tax=Brevundimonas sp. SORGH_AS_0993 TaxID=3041794 RepID=UPI00278A56AD|nr:ubiquinol-cytochrome C chaperone family protein [Brevundimonas sp. SORGH_AS_0993]MDQ1153515.1 cytochrome b pre-mRNA-processing protein 3 [Brevundimonas sp. SORGH_AS_0993]
MLKNLFRPRLRARIGDDLYAKAVAQARNVAFYTRLAVADRIDARFELYTLHVLLLVLRLRDENTAQGQETAQELFDVYVSALDHVLREEGVGDVAVGKKMRKLGEALYGRMTAYEPPLRAADADTLTEALARNVYGQDGGQDGAEHAAALAAYALTARANLAAQTFKAVQTTPAWPEV